MKRLLFALAVLIAASFAVACDTSTISCALTAADRQCWIDSTGPPTPPSKTHRGDLTISQNGYVLDDTLVLGCVNVRANDVRITNSVIRSNHGCRGGFGESGFDAIVATGNNGGGGIHDLIVVDTEIDGLGVARDSMGIGQTEYACIRCDIRGVAKGAKADQNVLVYDSYIHDPLVSGIHSEGVFYDGGDGNVHIIHNWIKGGNTAYTAAVSFNNDWEGTNSSIQWNYLEGVNGAGLTGGALKPWVPHMDHITIIDNVISPNVPYCKLAYGFDLSRPGNVWRNNANSVTGAQVLPPPPGEPTGC